MKNAIFWDFIEEERNNILKEYEFSVLDSAEIDLVISGHDMPVTLEENLFRPLVERFGMGEDARDVYKMALQWWETELTQIETDLGKNRKYANKSA